MLKVSNLSHIVDAAHQAFQNTADEIAAANIQAIESTRYQWPRTTHRQNGEVVTSPRDIVDTRELLDSQSLTRTSNHSYELAWSAEHAAKVHEGETTKTGQHRPARRWTQQAIAGDSTAPPEWTQPAAILNVPTHFRAEFKRISQLT